MTALSYVGTPSGWMGPFKIEEMSDAKRFLVLLGLAVALFFLSVLVFLRLLPGPLTDGDYLIIGCLSTLISLIVVFVLLVMTGALGSRNLRDAFFQKRKR